jgi:endonuclease/exonuclease/phosphatase family metal-dependent hydrolase
MRWFTNVVVLLALANMGCSSEDGEVGSITAVTYNGGLARGFVPGAEARQPLVAEAVAGLAADAVCLQEIWLASDVAAVKSASAGRFPTALFLDPTGPGMTGEAACTEEDLEPLLTCGTAHGCDVACGDELVACVVGNCGSEFGDLNTNAPACSQCLQANVGNPLDDIIDTCTTASSEFAFGGSFGIGIITNQSVSASDEKVFSSTTNRRGVVYARLDTELGPVHAFCTHLTAIFNEEEIPYPRPTGSWREEQAAQINELLAWANEKAGDEPVLLMGDFNTGPATATSAAVHPEHYQTLLAGGYSAPYAEHGQPCTFCEDNPLVGSDHDGSVLIDHVFIRGFSAPETTSARVLDQSIVVPICDVDTPSALSDHYGVSVTVNAEVP